MWYLGTGISPMKSKLMIFFFNQIFIYWLRFIKNLPSQAHMCPQGKKRVDAFLSEHTTHSSIWKHNIIPYDQSNEFIYKPSQHFFFVLVLLKNLYYWYLLILI